MTHQPPSRSGLYLLGIDGAEFFRFSGLTQLTRLIFVLTESSLQLRQLLIIDSSGTIYLTRTTKLVLNALWVAIAIRACGFVCEVGAKRNFSDIRESDASIYNTSASIRSVDD